GDFRWAAYFRITPLDSLRYGFIASAVLVSALAISGCGGRESASENSTTSSSLVKQRQEMVKKVVEEARQAPCLPADPKKQANGAIRESLMTLLAYPNQSGAWLEAQLLGKARLEILKVEGSDKQAYFYLPPADSDGENLAHAICRLAVNKSRVEVGKEKDGKFEFADYSFLRTPQKAVFLRVPFDNLRLDSDTSPKFPFQHGTYAPTLEELHFFMHNESVYGGLLEAIPDSQAYGQTSLYNYGAIVAKQGEGSLQRFVSDLTKDIGASDPDAREKKIQRLADLVSREIAPSPEEIPLNIVKRANEVLITGQADYPSRAILLGSLLEQLQEDYIFVYSKNYLAVAVKQGRFPAKNEYQTTWEDANWLMIDTTKTGFRIGLDEAKMRPGSVKYIQRPRQNSVITNLTSGSTLPFR
ncbi:MAG: hypothetical protein ACREBD_26485, partial [Blastocatellia bacterium]